MPVPAPLALHTDHVRPEWIDHNQHLNIGYYIVVFDYASDAWLDYVGFTQEYRRANRITTMAVEMHANFVREVHEGDPLRFTTQLLAFDAKRIHYVHCMYHAREGYLAATNELMTVHIDLASRRVAPMGRPILDRLAMIWESHEALPRPPQVGRVMGVPGKG